MKQRTILRRLVAVILCLAWILPWQSMAVQTTYAVIAAESVRVRTGPGINYGSIFHEGSEIFLTRGYGVIVTGPSQPGEDGNPTPWYPVEIPYNGATYYGYIRSDLVSLFESVEPDPILPGNAVITIDATESVYPGEDFSVTVTVKSDRPIGAWFFIMEYPAPTLTYRSGADSDLGGKLAFFNSSYGTGEISYQVHFTMMGNAPAGFLIQAPQIIGYDDEMAMTAANASATVAVVDMTWEIVGGDVNGDGKINTGDIIRLKNYLANYNYESGASTYSVTRDADVNGDGKINSGDIIRLKNYLANLSYD